MTGLWFVAAGLKAAGFALALAGVMLIAVQVGQRRDPGPLHRRLEEVWRTAQTTGWGALARLVATRLLDATSRVTATGFERADRGPFLDTLFIGLMFIVCLSA